LVRLGGEIEARAVYEALRSADRDPAGRTTVADLVDRADAPPAERKEESPGG
jgi:hypothetical protein